MSEEVQAQEQLQCKVRAQHGKYSTGIQERIWSLSILWSPLAEQIYYDNLEYLHKNWPPSVLQKFIDDVDQTMNLIERNSEIFNWWDSDKNYKIGYMINIYHFFTVSMKSISLNTCFGIITVIPQL